MSSKGGVAALIFGGISLISLFGLGYYFFFLRSSKKPLPTLPAVPKNEGKIAAPVENDEDDDDDVHNPDVAAEDVDSEEDEEEEHDEAAEKKSAEEAAKNAELKSSYDDAIRLAMKLLSGNAYIRAADKFKEAIKLAEGLPGISNKELITLYNNCSAMFEKAGRFDESLLDINIVLHMDSKHLKARVRRARIFEAQGRLKEAMNDHVVAMLIEQTMGTQPSNTVAVDNLCKTIAAKEAVKLVEKIRSGPERKLPVNSYCSSYLECFPSIFQWKAQYKNADRYYSIPPPVLCSETC